MAAIQPESPEGKILMKVFDKANSILQQKQDEVQKEKESAHKKSEAARRGWETRRAKATAALRIQRMIRSFISKTSVVQEAGQAFTEHKGSKKKEPQIDQNNKPDRNSETTKAPEGMWHTMRDKMSPGQIAYFEKQEERRVRMIENRKEKIVVKEAELQIKKKMRQRTKWLRSLSLRAISMNGKRAQEYVGHRGFQNMLEK